MFQLSEILRMCGKGLLLFWASKKSHTAMLKNKFISFFLEPLQARQL